MSTDIFEDDLELLEEEYELEDSDEDLVAATPPEPLTAEPDAVPFVHLHCHSHYSLLDGAARIDALIDRARFYGMPALALTDHGNLYGALEFYQKAKAKGIKPILGLEAYIAAGSRFDRSLGAGSRKDAIHHITLLAMNRTGYQNLLKLSSAAFLEGFYYNARIDKELLQEHHEGLLCLSGCVSSEFSRAILNSGESKNYEQAKNVALWYKELFGDRYYIEIQDNGLPIQRMVLEGAVPIARELGIPTVATNDVHYLTPDDADAQDLLLCVNSRALRTDEKRMRMDSDQFYFRSGSDMLRAMPGCEDAIRRTVEIAERCNLDLELGKHYLPTFTTPEKYTSVEYLRKLCIEGLKKRYAGNPKRFTPNGELSQEVTNRLDRELGVIEKQGYPNYFLIVWDFVRFAEEQGIHRTARGSGVGALVCFALNMSHVCPLEFDLLFERFLDEHRKEMPDIDIDFDQNRRDEVLEYVKQKYGEANVAQIGTFGTMAAKASINDVGRVLDMPIAQVKEISKLVPGVPKMTIKKAFEQSVELRNVYETNPSVRELIDYARQIEGLAKSAGTHACAVVIADKPILEYIPLQTIRKPGMDKESPGEYVTQWAMGDVEGAGLLKMDFLGLRNLSILARAIETVRETTGETIDPYRFPLDDAKTFQLLCRGETKGIFQLEGEGIRNLLKRMEPDDFRDIIATLALYRPGPLEGGMVDQYIDVKHKRKKAEYLNDVMKDVLEETNGVMVYQEQIMRILNRLGKIPLADSYSCIKAIGKKKEEQINKFQGDFIVGAGENGLSKEQAAELFELIKKFAGYGFNKSHSTAYALVAYMTAYLKTHYPIEFMAALLSSDISGRKFSEKDLTVEHVEDCERMGITVVPPDVNRSYRTYKVQDGQILFALSAIKGCGDAAADEIAAVREEGGPYRGLFDFCVRIDLLKCGRATVETLIKAGAFDSFGCKRSQLMQAVERAFKAGQSAAQDRKTGQKNMFGGGSDEEDAVSKLPGTETAGLPDIPEWDSREKAAFEKEVLGFCMTSDPLEQYKDIFETFRSHSNQEAVRLAHKKEATLCGIITEVRLLLTKKQQQYARILLDDGDDTISCVLWPDEYAACSQFARPDSLVFAVGKMDRKRKHNNEEEVNLCIEELIPAEQAEQQLAGGIAITVSEEEHGVGSLSTLFEILRGSPGRGELKLSIKLASGQTAQLKCRKMGVALNPELRRRVGELLGDDSLRFLRGEYRKKAPEKGTGPRTTGPERSPDQIQTDPIQPEKPPQNLPPGPLADRKTNPVASRKQGNLLEFVT